MATQREMPPRQETVLPNPISSFDHHLRVLDQSYIQFFQDRVTIEEQYIAQLAQLYQRTRYNDSNVDNGPEANTTIRQAWREARDSLDREAESRGAFASAIRNEVIMPLTILKEANERTRKRIKEEIKDSHTAHLEYQENLLPRLKQKYLKKVQEVEEYKNLDRPPIPSAGFVPIPQSIIPAPAASGDSPTSIHCPLNTNSGGALNASIPLPSSPPNPPLPAPQPQPGNAGPLAQGAARPSNQPPTQRNRSPSAGTTSSLSDIAQQSKKALKGFMNDGGSRPVLHAIRDNFGDRSNQAMKGVKAKREADEADKEYRKAVHWLETLRIKRVTTIRSGYTSLEDFIWEQSYMVKKVLQKYVDCQIGTASTNSQLANHIQLGLNKVCLEKDREIQTQSFANVDLALKRAFPPTLYYNFLVGDSKDLIFGTSLVDYATTRGVTGGPAVAFGLVRGGKMTIKDGVHVPRDERTRGYAIGTAQDAVPRLVRLCVQDIDSRGLLTEGIYRVSGRYANVQEMRHFVEKDEAAFEIRPQEDDVYCVSSLLKQYLRELPEPVFRFPLQERLLYTEDREEHITTGFKVIRNKMRRLPPVHQATLRLIIEHLARVASHVNQNKMDPKNLAIVFNAVLFGEDELPKGGDVLSLAGAKDTVLEDMIIYAPLLFDEQGPPSPPLSVATSEGPECGNANPSIYSSTNSPKSRKSPSLKPDRMQDFAPNMPSRPDYTLHPAARRGGGSASSTPPTPRLELSPAAKDLPLPGAVDLMSPSTDGAPPPSPASAKRRSVQQRASALPASVGHAHSAEGGQIGGSPRRSLSAFTVEGDSGEHWMAIGSTAGESDEERRRFKR